MKCLPPYPSLGWAFVFLGQCWVERACAPPLSCQCQRLLLARYFIPGTKLHMIRLAESMYHPATWRASLRGNPIGRTANVPLHPPEGSAVPEGTPAVRTPAGPRAYETVSQPLPSLRDSVLFPTLPSTPPTAPCWARLFRPYGAGFCAITPPRQLRRGPHTHIL